MEESNTRKYDVVILGGGLAGLTCALQCRKECPEATIAVLEKETHPVSEATHKVGESSVEVGAHYFYKVLDLEEHLEKEQIPKMGLRLFFDREDNSEIDNRLELGGTKFPPFPSYQFDRGRFENYLAKRCLSQGIDFIDSATIKDVHVNRGRKPHVILSEIEGRQLAFHARWVVDASGRAGLLKRKLELKRDCNHNASSAWIRFGERVKIDDWSEDAEWGKAHGEENPRWQSTNHLLGEGYWIWMIPLSSGSTSIGIVADEAIHPLNEFNSQEKWISWLEKYQPVLGRRVREKKNLIQDFGAIKRYARECKELYSRNRWAIVGDAGYFIDPFYSPGNDFIALANTYACDLIRRDLMDPAWSRLFNLYRFKMYNKLFSVFFNNTGKVFKENYQLFGNHQVMPVKIAWDWLIYWSITGHVFIHGRLCDTGMFLCNRHNLAQLDHLNEDMQAHFRKWHRAKPSRETGGIIDSAAQKIITDANRGLLDQLDDKAFDERFSENVAKMENLFWEIADHSGIPMETGIERVDHPAVMKGGFDEIFRITSPSADQEQGPPEDSASPDLPETLISA